MGLVGFHQTKDSSVAYLDDISRDRNKDAARFSFVSLLDLISQREISLLSRFDRWQGEWRDCSSEKKFNSSGKITNCPPCIIFLRNKKQSSSEILIILYQIQIRRTPEKSSSSNFEQFISLFTKEKASISEWYCFRRSPTLTYWLAAEKLVGNAEFTWSYVICTIFNI